MSRYRLSTVQNTALAIRSARPCDIPPLCPFDLYRPISVVHRSIRHNRRRGDRAYHRLYIVAIRRLFRDQKLVGVVPQCDKTNLDKTQSRIHQLSRFEQRKVGQSILLCFP